MKQERKDELQKEYEACANRLQAIDKEIMQLRTRMVEIQGVFKELNEEETKDGNTNK